MTMILTRNTLFCVIQFSTYLRLKSVLKHYYDECLQNKSNFQQICDGLSISKRINNVPEKISFFWEKKYYMIRLF